MIRKLPKQDRIGTVRVIILERENLWQEIVGHNANDQKTFGSGESVQVPSKAQANDVGVITLESDAVEGQNPGS